MMRCTDVLFSFSHKVWISHTPPYNSIAETTDVMHQSPEKYIILFSDICTKECCADWMEKGTQCVPYYQG